ncbi:MAG: FAD:protein FMN transferase [Tissierellales bacterium]|nr:FAD:protein FMN transferase [Tissierellales bacterium]MBN2827523.1 FAD:protein FMN transferase [Tissierellales bacterium]
MIYDLKKINLKLVFLLIMIMLMSGCTPLLSSNKSEAKVSQGEFLLNTYITITLYGTDSTDYFNDLFQEVSDLENRLSIHQSDSEVSIITSNAGLHPVNVSTDTYAVFEKSLAYSELSEGLFDITAGPLIELWSIGTPEERVPELEEIEKTLPLIDYKKILLNASDSTVFLSEVGMSANLGAIAKGYIADQIAERVQELGFNSAVLNFGGNVVLIGSKPDGSDFKVGIQNPDEPSGKAMGVFTASNLSIVTSGDYERFFVQDGVKYHHILNPFTGFPSDTDLKAVSIISDTSFDGDALSTSVLLLGLDRGLELINTLDGIEAIFITKSNEIILTDGIGDSFELIDNNFVINK